MCSTCMEAQEVSVVYITIDVAFIDISATADWVMHLKVPACLDIKGNGNSREIDEMTMTSYDNSTIGYDLRLFPTHPCWRIAQSCNFG